MAEEFIEEIYGLSDLYEKLKEMELDLLRGRTTEAVHLWYEGGKEFSDLLNRLQSQNSPHVMPLYEAAHALDQHWKDPSLTASLIREKLLPAFRSFLKDYGDIDVSEGRWRLASSGAGYLTLQDLTTGTYLHSPSDPMWEARMLAEDLMKPDKEFYEICGLGLGYLAYQLFVLSFGTAKIRVYEPDEQVLLYAGHYGVLDRIPEENLEIIQGAPEKLARDFLRESNDPEHTWKYAMPWFTGVYPEASEELPESERLDEVFRRENEKMREINLRWNLKKRAGFSESLKDHFHKKEWVIVAAGPSLNENLEFLKQSRESRTIVCVNTSLKRLAKEGLRPDLVTAADPLPQLAKHLDGLEDFTEGIPLLADALTSWEYVNRFRGQVYLAYEEGADQEFPGELIGEGSRWAIGSTVTSLALEAAYRYGAEQIYLVGVDLGFPGGKTHAEGVAHSGEEVQGELEAPSNDGGTVRTNAVYEMFREDLERQIARHPEVPVYNLSAHGRVIAGTCPKVFPFLP